MAVIEWVSGVDVLNALSLQCWEAIVELGPEAIDAYEDLADPTSGEYLNARVDALSRYWTALTSTVCPPSLKSVLMHRRCSLASLKQAMSTAVGLEDTEAHAWELWRVSTWVRDRWETWPVLGIIPRSWVASVKLVWDAGLEDRALVAKVDTIGRRNTPKSYRPDPNLFGACRCREVIGVTGGGLSA